MADGRGISIEDLREAACRLPTPIRRGINRAESKRDYPWEAFLLVAQQNPFREPRKPTDGDKKKKKKKKKKKY